MFIISLLIGAGVLYYGIGGGVITYRIDDLLRSVALNALYVPFLNTAHLYRSSGLIFPADPPAWSLFLEMLASVAFLFLFDLRRKTLILIAVICYLALISAGFYFARMNGSFGLDLSNGFDSRTILGGIPRVGFGFTLGILLQWLVRDGIDTRFMAAMLRRVPYPSFALYAVLTAIFLFPHPLRGLYPALSLAVAAPAIVFVGAQIRTTRRSEVKIAHFLGYISYPVYCLHVPILRIVLFVRGGEHGSSFLVSAFTVAASVAIAVVLTEWFDKPVRAVLSDRLLTSRPLLVRSTRLNELSSSPIEPDHRS
jgi:peptidoglycan/LPS O-acetylase OafA/YrhL